MDPFDYLFFNTGYTDIILESEIDYERPDIHLVNLKNYLRDEEGKLMFISNHSMVNYFNEEDKELCTRLSDQIYAFTEDKKNKLMVFVLKVIK